MAWGGVCNLTSFIYCVFLRRTGSDVTLSDFFEISVSHSSRNTRFRVSRLIGGEVCAVSRLTPFRGCSSHVSLLASHLGFFGGGAIAHLAARRASQLPPPSCPAMITRCDAPGQRGPPWKRVAIEGPPRLSPAAADGTRRRRDGPSICARYVPLIPRGPNQTAMAHAAGALAPTGSVEAARLA